MSNEYNQLESYVHVMLRGSSLLFYVLLAILSYEWSRPPSTVVRAQSPPFWRGNDTNKSSYNPPDISHISPTWPQNVEKFPLPPYLPTASRPGKVLSLFFLTSEACGAHDFRSFWDSAANLFFLRSNWRTVGTSEGKKTTLDWPLINF